MSNHSHQSNPNLSQKLEGSSIGFLIGFAGLLVFQLVGEATVRLMGIPVPGPVIGLLFMLVFLLSRKALKIDEPESLLNTSSALLTHLSLLFVPAGVGIITHVDRIKEQWLSISIALMFASIITLFVTAWSLKGFIRLINKREPQ